MPRQQVNLSCPPLLLPTRRPWWALAALALATPTHLPNHTCSSPALSSPCLYSCHCQPPLFLFSTRPLFNQQPEPYPYQTTRPRNRTHHPPANRTMKREGWQHGTVRISRNKVLRVAAAAADAEASEAEAVAVATTGKAPAKPTNASRSTGKCRRPRCAGCHTHPVTKARDKAKGAHKLRACDVALNHRLVSWRVVDQGRAVPEYRGASASSLLAYLAGSGTSWHEDDEEADPEAAPPGADGGLSDLYDLFVGRRAGAAADPARDTDDVDVGGEIQAAGEQDGDGGEEDGIGEEEDGDMGFCMVGITIAVEFSDGEEDWIVVEEI